MVQAPGLLVRRWHSERPLMLRRWRQEIAKHEYPAYPQGYAPVPPVADADSCHCYRGMGVLRKRKPYDCGNPRCGLCHADKFGDTGRRTRERRRAFAYETAANGEAYPATG